MLKGGKRGIYQSTAGYNSGRRRLRRLRRDPSVLALVRAVVATRDVDILDLLRVTRGNAAVADARHLAMYLVHVQLGRPLEEVAFLFGRDRTTVAYACRLMEDRRDIPATEIEIGRIASVVDARSARRGRSLRHVV